MYIQDIHILYLYLNIKISLSDVTYKKLAIYIIKGRVNENL